MKVLLTFITGLAFVVRVKGLLHSIQIRVANRAS